MFRTTTLTNILYAAMAACVAPHLAFAHEAPKTTGERGPVPEILMRHAPLMMYENGARIPFVVREDKTLFWIEIVPDVEKSFAGPARWTWDGGEFCMDIDDHPTVCFELEPQLTAGRVYDSTVRYLDDENGNGEEIGSKPFKFMLIRTE